MVDGAAAAVATSQRDAVVLDRGYVALLPGILMTANYHAGLVAPEQQHVVLAEVVVAIEPVLESEVRVNVGRLRDEDRLLYLVFGYALHRSGGRSRRGVPQHEGDLASAINRIYGID